MLLNRVAVGVADILAERGRRCIRGIRGRSLERGVLVFHDSICGGGLEPVNWRMVVGKKRVLVVDDEPAVRELVQALLAHEGHEVETACCGKEALIMIAERSFDLVFTDYLMPEMNGQQLAHEIKKYRPLLPVVLVTGHRPESTPAELSGVLHKPFSRHDLLQTVTGLTQS